MTNEFNYEEYLGYFLESLLGKDAKVSDVNCKLALSKLTRIKNQADERNNAVDALAEIRSNFCDSKTDYTNVSISSMKSDILYHNHGSLKYFHNKILDAIGCHPRTISQKWLPGDFGFSEDLVRYLDKFTNESNDNEAKLNVLTDIRTLLRYYLGNCAEGIADEKLPNLVSGILLENINLENKMNLTKMQDIIDYQLNVLHMDEED